MKKVLLFSASILALTVSPSYAQDAKAVRTEKAVVAEKDIQKNAVAQQNQVFKLGEISVSVANQSVSNVGNLNTVTAEEIQAYTDSDTLDKAVALLPGVDLTYQIGAKNQKGVSIRGFTTRQISVMVDGVSQALPYDNDPDMQRYLTNDLSEIQVAKGISSVLNGPNTLGGVINLVTKRPTKEIEGNLTIRTKFDNDGKYNGIQNSFNLGTNQGSWYLQTGGTYNDIKHWKVSRDYTPVPNGAEDGGRRENSDSKDYKFNFKLGYTPNETDEYVIAYNYQHAVMGVPYYDGVPENSTTYRRFDPYDHWGIYTLTNTAVGETGYVKTRLFYDEYSNHFYMYDSPSLSTLKYTVDDYQDYDFGANVEGGFDLNSYNTIKAAFHYRRDVHTKRELHTDDLWEREKDDTYSVALEDTIHATAEMDIILGASYDWIKTKEPKNNSKVASDAEYRKDDDAFNPMAAVRYRYNETGTVYAGVAHKSRFATQKERFSTRQGTYAVNPMLKAEKAVNYEIGFSDTFADKLKVESSIFYNDIDDALMVVSHSVSGKPKIKYQVQNVGEAYSYGLELAAAYQFTDDISVGMGYTYMRKKLRDNPLFSVLTNVPKHKFNMYADIGLIEGLRVVPVITAYSSRYSPVGGSPAESGAVEPANAARSGGFMTADLKFVYSPWKNLDIEIGAANIFDKDYELSDGYPSEGRNFFLTLSTKF